MTVPRRPATGPVTRRRGANLPHWTREGGTYAVTFRLDDAIPAAVVEGWRLERLNIIRRAEAMGRPPSRPERDRLDVLSFERIEEYLHRDAGACHMRDARIAALVADALTFFDGDRYTMFAWCVMPNHVHAVFQPAEGFELSGILHSWKSFTSNRCNKLLRRTGAFWQAESYDHLVRDADDLRHQVRYVLENPAKAGLRDWPWVGGSLTV